MHLIIKTFSELSATELYEILRLREAVFIVEQNCPYPEADGKDPDAVHFWYSGENGRGTGLGTALIVAGATFLAHWIKAGAVQE